MSIFYVLSKASDEEIAFEISVLYFRGHQSLCDSLVVTQAEEILNDHIQFLSWNGFDRIPAF